MHDQIISRLNSMDWMYANSDERSLQELRIRIGAIGAKFGLISYSDLVKDVVFCYPNVNSGQPFQISIHDWSGLHRRIVGDCLGYLSRESYFDAGFMCSALVIGRSESMPSDIFFEWMEWLGVLPDTKEDTVLRFWADQVKKAHQWYRYNKGC